MAFTFYSKDQTDAILGNYLTTTLASTTYLPFTGGTLTGNLDIIENYLKFGESSYIKVTSGNLKIDTTGILNIGENASSISFGNALAITSFLGSSSFAILPTCSVVPTINSQLANKKYVDDTVAGAVFGTLTDLTLTGNLNVGGTITGNTTITDGTTVSVINDPVDGAEVVLTPGVYMCWIKVDGRSFSLGNLIFDIADTYVLSSVFTIYVGINTSSSAQLIYSRADNIVRVYFWAETDSLVSLAPYTGTYSTTMTIYFRKIT